MCWDGMQRHVHRDNMPRTSMHWEGIPRLSQCQGKHMHCELDQTVTITPRVPKGEERGVKRTQRPTSVVWPMSQLVGLSMVAYWAHMYSGKHAYRESLVTFWQHNQPAIASSSRWNMPIGVLLACCGFGTRPISIIDLKKCSIWVADGYFGTNGSLVWLALINV
ncbi:hypothetical protein Hanom_Chr04g00345151 [Helianthus anomalus]